MVLLRKILEEIKIEKYNDLEDLVYIFQLTYDGIIDILDLKYIPSKRTGCSLHPGMYEINDTNKTLEYISLDNVRKSVTIDDIRLKSNLNIIQTLIFIRRSFFIHF